MKRTVVHFLDSNAHGGVENVLFSLLTGLKRDGWAPVLLHHDSPGIKSLLDNLEKSGVACYPTTPIERANFISGLFKFRAQLRSLDAAIFHAHLNWPLACRNQLLAARLSRVPGIVATSHLCSSLDEVHFRALKSWVQQKSIDRYIAVSDFVATWLHAELGIRRSKLTVVKNGIQASLFRAKTPSNSAGDQLPIVFTSSRLHADKGLFYLLEAAKLVPNARFVLAGDGPDRAALEDTAKSLGISERVSFLGYRNDIPELLSTADVFVLPSLHEALGLSIIEAMASGKPVIATAVGGVPEIVKDGVTGLLVAPSEPIQLAAAIRRVLNDPSLAMQLAPVGKAAVETTYTVDAMVAGTARIYEEVLARKHALGRQKASEATVPTRVQA